MLSFFASIGGACSGRSLLVFALLCLSGCASKPVEYHPIAGANANPDKRATILNCEKVAQLAYDRVVRTGEDNFEPRVTYSYSATTLCNGDEYNARCTTQGQIYDSTDYAAQKTADSFVTGFMAGMKKAKTMRECMEFNGYTAK